MGTIKERKMISKRAPFLLRIPFNVILLAMVHGLEHFHLVSLPALFLLFQHDFDLTYTNLGTLVFLRGVLSFLQPVAGFFVDRWGAKIMLILSCLILGISTFGLAFSPTFLFLLLFQFIQGIGSISIHPAGYSLSGKISSNQPMGRRMSLQSFGGFFGNATGFLVIAFIGSYLGWRSTLLFLSFIGFIFAFLLTRVKYPIAQQVEQASDERAIKKANGKNSGTDSNKDSDSKVEGLLQNQLKKSYAPLVVIAVASAFHGIFSHSLSSFLPTFLSANYGVSVSEAGFLSSILYFSALGGLLVGGEVSDKVDRVYLITTFSIIAAVFFLVLALVPLSTFVLVFVLILIGFGVYFVNPARHSLTMEVSKTGSEGRTFGLTFGLAFGGGAIAAPLLGYLADFYSIRVAFASILTVSALVTAFTFLLLKKWGYGR